MNIEYQRFLNDSMLEFVKKVLVRIQDEGPCLNQLLYISYRTDHPLVVLSKRMKDRYPEEITIIMQYQFEDLKLKLEGFSVTLSFDGIKENIYVPFEALISFIDPTNGYSFKFKPQVNIVNKSQNDLLAVKNVEQIPRSNNSDDASNNVIVLDKFRKPNKPN